jgi:hypothetical protein
MKRIFRWMSKYVKFFNENKTKNIIVVHHNDADGICSASILKLALEELGHEVETICIEKVHEKVVEKIHEKKQGFTFYTDLGGFTPHIIDKNSGKEKILIIDHHPVKKYSSNEVKILDLEAVGISGDQFVTASSLCYFFTKKLGVKRELSHLAVIGAVGDYHDRSGGLLGFDRLAFEVASEKGLAEIGIGKFKEKYFIKPYKDFADVVAEKLGLLGFVGYYDKSYLDAIKALIHGFDEKIERKVRKYRKLRNEKYDLVLRKLRKRGLIQEKKVQWFHLHNQFYPMGVKTVGNFCQIIKDMSFVDDEKYLIGMQNVPKKIPDLGRINWNLVKVSGRTPYTLEKKILKGKAIGFDKLFPLATKKVNGTVDAIHPIAAATLISKGYEEKFVKWLDKYAQRA